MSPHLVRVNIFTAVQMDRIRHTPLPSQVGKGIAQPPPLRSKSVWGLAGKSREKRTQRMNAFRQLRLGWL